MVQAASSRDELPYKASHAPYVKRIKRFKNYFDTHSKFPLFRIYLRRSLPLVVVVVRVDRVSMMMGGFNRFALQLVEFNHGI